MRDRHRYCPRDTLTSLALGRASTIAGVLSGGAVFALATWVARARLLDIGWAWYAFALCFVLDDLAYYWFHPSAHRVRWFWASHVVHHSSQHYNLSTALRQTWTGFFSLNFLFRLPRAIEAVMNTPSHHRVHHATNPRYLDRNCAGVFIVWDRLFGTYEPERDDEPPRYGLVRDPGSFSLVWAAFHEWVAIARDVWAAPWRAKPGYLVRPPGWSHDGSRETSETLRAKWEARSR